MLLMKRPSGRPLRSRVPSSVLAAAVLAGLLLLSSLAGFVVPRLWHGFGSAGTAAWLALVAAVFSALGVLVCLLTWARRMRWPARLALLVAVAVTLYGLGLPTGPPRLPCSRPGRPGQPNPRRSRPGRRRGPVHHGRRGPARRLVRAVVHWRGGGRRSRGRRRPARACSARPWCSPGTATGCCWSTRGGWATVTATG